MGVAAEGGGRVRGGPLRRVLGGLVETARERASERRARAAAREGAVTRFPRSVLFATLEARAAVRAGVRLDDFLRRQLAQYATRLPVPLEELPITVEVSGGEAVIRARARADARAARRDAPAPAPPEPPLAREVRAAEAAVADLDARAVRARQRVEEVQRELADAIAAGRVIPRAAVDATPEQLGRPPVPPPWPGYAARAFVGILAAAEGWRFVGPALAAAGLAGAPDEALRAAPLPAGFALAFSVGAATAAFVLAGAALARATAALAPAGPDARRGLLATSAAVAALLVAAVSAAAAFPHHWAQLALVAVVPFAGAALWRAADALDAQRAAALAEALVWDRARAVEAVDRARREEVIARADTDLDAVLAEREEAVAALRSLRRAALAAGRRADLAARATASRLDRLSEGLACALELDRYLYLRLSASLAAPRERHARPRVEPAVERLGVAG